VLRTAAVKRLEGTMNEDTFNMEVRKFLKKVGVTSQREIENAVREAMKAGLLAGNERLKARIKLEVERINLELVIEDDLALS
jgi:Family of unknown function (DUF6494)